MARTRSLGKPAVRSSTRCAIYTRKSSEEGLEQEFNSLDAQRASCEAYVTSQRHEGWSILPQFYDDGGISGGTMERPALSRLLGDIEAGRIDTVVVYKVDRLTRSLGDFARIVEVFDRAGVSFVSVTQQFNTTTSMGRLTLNMLLSFAQFEREVTGERIRDKIAASKQKGMWMGGHPPLGYDVQDRKLIVNEAEAETVRHIFRRYIDLRSAHLLERDLLVGGIVSKRRSGRNGEERGGKPLARGALYLMLQNRLYRGETVHNGQSYPGQHAAIVEAELWDAAQAILEENRIERQTGSRAAEPSLLCGLIHDGDGEGMTPSHANKKGRRYRYYVSRSLVGSRQSNAGRGWRVPAGDLEEIVETTVLSFLGDASRQFSALTIDDVNRRAAVMDRAADLVRTWPRLAAPEKRSMLHRLVARVDLLPGEVRVALRAAALTRIGEEPQAAKMDDAPAVHRDPIILTVQAELKRTGMETRLLVDSHRHRRQPDRSLLRLLAQSRHFHEMVMRGDGSSIAALAEEAQVSASYFTRILRLSFLAPDIVKVILDNDHPLELSAKSLAHQLKIPPPWSDQKAMLLGN